MIKEQLETLLEAKKFKNKIELVDFSEDGLDDIQYELDDAGMQADKNWAFQDGKKGEKYFSYDDKVAKSKDLKRLLKNLRDDEKEMKSKG